MAPKHNEHQTVATVGGYEINIPSEAKALDALIHAAQRGEGFACFTLNLDHLVKLREDTDFQEAYRAATFVTADGAPVAMLARRQWSEVERTTGADLLVPLCKAAAQNKLPIYLFGTEQNVLDELAAFLDRCTGGGIVIAGKEAPPYGFDPKGPEADAAVERIRQSQALLCFVMLGAPKQELFAAHALRRGINCGFVCVGAAGDFITGHQVRAPKLFQDLNLEWLWRLSQNPARLGQRYFRCAMLFAGLLVSGGGKR